MSLIRKVHTMTILKDNVDLVHSTIKEVWKNNISSDYEKNFLLKEDTLKNAFYFHLRRKLGEAFLQKNNLAIFTEYYVPELKQRVDLVVVEIDPIKAQSGYLGDAVKSIIAIVEMKYKGNGAADDVFEGDVEKVLNYSQLYTEEITKFYVAFIREKYFYADEVTYFLDEENISKAKGKLIELLAYWIIDNDMVHWEVMEH